MKSYIDSSVKRIENQINEFEKIKLTENETIRNNLNQMKEYIEVCLVSLYQTEIQSLSTKADYDRDERTQFMQGFVEDMNNEFDKVHCLVYILLIFILKMRIRRGKSLRPRLLILQKRL